MSTRRSAHPNLFSLVGLTVGAAASFGVQGWELFRWSQEYPEQVADEVAPLLIGACLLYVPYVILAKTGRSTPPWVGYGVLAVLLATSALFFVAAASASTGAIIGVYLWPFQCLIAALPAIRKDRVSRR